MAKKTKRELIKLKSTKSPYIYWKRKNKLNTPDRMTLVKFDPILREHVEFKEAK